MIALHEYPSQVPLRAVGHGPRDAGDIRSHLSNAVPKLIRDGLVVCARRTVAYEATFNPTPWQYQDEACTLARTPGTWLTHGLRECKGKEGLAWNQRELP